MSLHNDQQKAHFEKNPKLIVDQFADNLISVNHGIIDSTSTDEENTSRFQGYFNSVKFIKWEDISSPKIRFSKDASMAYMVVDKLVILEMADSVGNPVEETTHYGWVSIFKKHQGEWKLECIASTNEPEIIKPIN